MGDVGGSWSRLKNYRIGPFLPGFGKLISCNYNCVRGVTVYIIKLGDSRIWDPLLPISRANSKVYFRSLKVT